MAIRLTGLGGFDSSGVIDQLVALARQPINDLDSKKSKIDSAGVMLNSFSTKLGTLKNAAIALSTPAGFSSFSATSSDTGVVASATGNAVAASYSLNVTQVARAQKSRSDAVASSTTALGQTGKLELKVGSADAKSINIASTDTLADIATKINGSGARVSASVVNLGNNEFKLAIQGLDTGAANAVTMTEQDGFTLGLNKPANMYESAQDASFTLDGMTFTRSTNSINDAIPGVTLALTKPTTGAATLKVTSDSSAIKTKISSFVSAYNDVVNTGHNTSGYGSTKATNSVLSGDTGIRRSLDRIATLVSSAVPGASSSLQSLGSLGIRLAKDGTLSFDSAKFDTAMEKDPSAVRKLFVTDTASASTGIMKTLGDAVDSLVTNTGGAVKSRIESLQAQSKRLATSREAKEKNVEEYETQIRKQFSKLDEAMSKYSAMSSQLSGLNTNTSG